MLTSVITEIQTFSIMPEIDCHVENTVLTCVVTCKLYALSLLECMTLSLQLCNDVTRFKLKKHSSFLIFCV